MPQVRATSDHHAPDTARTRSTRVPESSRGIANTPTATPFDRALEIVPVSTRESRPPPAPPRIPQEMASSPRPRPKTKTATVSRGGFQLPDRHLREPRFRLFGCELGCGFVLLPPKPLQNMHLRDTRRSGSNLVGALRRRPVNCRVVRARCPALSTCQPSGFGKTWTDLVNRIESATETSASSLEACQEEEEIVEIAWDAPFQTVDDPGPISMIRTGVDQTEKKSRRRRRKLDGAARELSKEVEDQPALQAFKMIEGDPRGHEATRPRKQKRRPDDDDRGRDREKPFDFHTDFEAIESLFAW